MAVIKNLRLYLAFLLLPLLLGCSSTASVDLVQALDTEAAEVLTSQRDASAELCGVVSRCEQALVSDQAVILEFRSERDANCEVQPGDDHVRGVFLVRWQGEPVSGSDRALVINLLETVHAWE